MALADYRYNSNCITNLDLLLQYYYYEVSLLIGCIVLTVVLGYHHGCSLHCKYAPQYHQLLGWAALH